MTSARKTAEELIRTYEQSRGSFLRQDKTFIIELIEQAVLAAGPRVVDESQVDRLSVQARKEVSPEDIHCPSRSAVYQRGWDKGFRAAASMNAIAHLESVMPSENELHKAVKENELSADLLDAENTLVWLRAEVLRRLG